MNRELLRRIMYLSGIAIGVYLVFRYLLPLVVPFLFAFVAAKLIFPIIEKIRKKYQMSHKIVRLVFMAGLLILVSAIFLAVGYLLFVQIKKFVCNIAYYRALLEGNVQSICCRMEGLLGVNSGNIYGMIMSKSKDLTRMITRNGTAACRILGSYLVSFFFFLVATCLFVNDYREITDDLTGSYIYRKIRPLIRCIKEMVNAFAKTQLIIMGLVAGVCTLAFFILKNPYALLLGIVTAVIDAFPVLGSGMLLVPYAVICALQGKIFDGAVLLAAYLVCLIIREVLEPKIMGQQSGLRPIYMLFSFYVGVRLFGLSGIILGPIGMAAIYNIYKTSTSPNEHAP